MAFGVISCSRRTSAVIPAKAGIQRIHQKSGVAGQQDFVRCADCYFRWIPACAGMTEESSI
jgi:hypothetical protein